MHARTHARMHAHIQIDMRVHTHPCARTFTRARARARARAQLETQRQEDRQTDSSGRYHLGNICACAELMEVSVDQIRVGLVERQRPNKYASKLFDFVSNLTGAYMKGSPLEGVISGARPKDKLVASSSFSVEHESIESLGNGTYRINNVRIFLQKVRSLTPIKNNGRGCARLVC